MNWKFANNQGKSCKSQGNLLFRFLVGTLPSEMTPCPTWCKTKTLQCPSQSQSSKDTILRLDQCWTNIIPTLEPMFGIMLVHPLRRCFSSRMILHLETELSATLSTSLASANMRRRTNVVSLLVHRLRRWPSSETALVPCIVLTVMSLSLADWQSCAIHTNKPGSVCQRIDQDASPALIPISPLYPYSQIHNKFINQN